MSALQNLFMGPPAGNGAQPQRALVEIRAVMLQAIGPFVDPGVLALQRKLAFAHGFQDLWYLRGDVLAVIAVFQGETVAKAKMADITDMFKGYLPPGLVSRPSPLSEHMPL
jgi:hypothetical protein